MSGKLVKQWRLAVLQVRLDLSERTRTVAVELVGYPEGKLRRYWRRRYAPEEFALPDGTEAPTSPQIPAELRDAVTRSLHREFGHEEALWLRLVRPYGYLGAVPWETVLVEASGRPVIRVPDRFPVATDLGHVWSVAVALDAAPGTSWAPRYLHGLLAALDSAVSVPIEADIFADAATYRSLTSLAPSMPDGLLIHLHDPSRADEAHAERTQLEVPQFQRTRRLAAEASSAAQRGALVWADWIVTGLDGRAVRALHLVSDSAFDADRPLLTISLDPAQPAHHTRCTYVSSDESARLADTVGASVLSFGSPADNPGDVATRVMADNVGQQRPGPTIYSSLRLDPRGDALAHAHAFVANKPGTAPIPADPSLFAYLQPEHVEASLQEHWPGLDQPGAGWRAGRAAAPDQPVPPALWPALAASTSEAVSEHFEWAGAVPSWVATSERYIDANVAQLVETAAPAGGAAAARMAYDLGTAQALTELRDLIERKVAES
ncbi:hypothetical protein [Streptacidiphilus sp. EB103A]|uniref:hypothetical protein n=1 Tax=Streptacidiphilus sp. EB103A TaxID=3156275 RepID=UPI0035164CFA